MSHKKRNEEDWNSSKRDLALSIRALGQIKGFLQVVEKMKRKPVSLERAKKLGNQFAEELQKEFKFKLSWCFIGSIAKNNYRPGKSDIDMIIIPKDKGMFALPAIRRMLNKVEEYKKYGTVFKKGRYISLIDPMIMVSLQGTDNIRKAFFGGDKK